MKFISCKLFILSCLFCSLTVYSQTKQSDENTSFQSNVEKLPEVDTVEISAIKWIISKRNEIDCNQPDIICSAFPGKILASKTLKGKKAEETSKLWRNLENGNGAGCFAPAYVLRFYKKDKLILTTDICFHCCNAALPGSGIRSICGNAKAIESFKKFVTTELPYPKQEKK